jgi:hypothetical protein
MVEQIDSEGASLSVQVDGHDCVVLPAVDFMKSVRPKFTDKTKSAKI